MIEMVVVLHLIIWDADTGKQLALQDHTFEKPTFEITPADLIEECRTYGVDLGTKVVGWFREGFGPPGTKAYPNAFANVDCQWERKGDPV